MEKNITNDIEAPTLTTLFCGSGPNGTGHLIRLIRFGGDLISWRYRDYTIDGLSPKDFIRIADRCYAAQQEMELTNPLSEVSELIVEELSDMTLRIFYLNIPGLPEDSMGLSIDYMCWFFPSNTFQNMVSALQSAKEEYQKIIKEEKSKEKQNLN